MKKIEMTAADLARRFVGINEIKGAVDNPLILAMLKLDASWPQNDETPWCSAFANFVCWLLGLPRSHSLAARSWLLVGSEVKHKFEALIGFDVVVLQRGSGPQPDASVINASGHVGFFDGFENNLVQILGGNQGDSVRVAKFPIEQILGIRRLFG
jgi:uncharacterized protein (TIGR02594 family)